MNAIVSGYCLLYETVTINTRAVATTAGEAMTTIATHGRLLEEEEFPRAAVLEERFGSIKQTFALVKRVTGPSEWDEITTRRTEDLLVYLALGRFQGRPPMTTLPLGLQRDILAFFGNYTKACRQADGLLFRSGNTGAVDEACKRATVGKLLPNALYVHRDALDSLEPLLRVYEGCARAYLGEVEGAHLIKLHRHSGKVSYLVYPDFETDPHPALRRSIKLSLRTREIDCFDYAKSTNPPILHRKETFLPPGHALVAKFTRLTRQEEKHGLLDEMATIGTREGWERRLAERGFTVRGHRLVSRRGEKAKSGNREIDENRKRIAGSAHAGVSASFFFARSAWLLVMAPASTMSSIFLNFVMCFSLIFAMRILWLDVGNSSL